jgi:hypothetical protein
MWSTDLYLCHSVSSPYHLDPKAIPVICQEKHARSATPRSLVSYLLLILKNADIPVSSRKKGYYSGNSYIIYESLQNKNQHLEKEIYNENS